MQHGAGRDERFSTIEQLVQCVRPGVLLDAASMPCLHTTDRHGRLLPLNRYILDYWGHNQKQALVTANGMREGASFSCFVKFLRDASSLPSPHVRMLCWQYAWVNSVRHIMLAWAQVMACSCF